MPDDVKDVTPDVAESVTPDGAETAAAPEAPEKQEFAAHMKELTDRLETGMKELYTGDKYKDYLKAMAQFHSYSPRNIMLIEQQFPRATRVASFKTWDEQFSRHVIKGQHAIRIFAPIAVKESRERDKLDPETGAPLLDADGKAIREKVTADTVRFKLVPVFDVSQTYGEPLPQLAENLTGDVAHYEAFMDALKAVSPLPVAFEPMQEEQDGYCRFGEKIGIREGMSETQTVSAVIHEIAHAQLHDKSLVADASEKSKRVKEVEAESVSYVVAQHYGIETSPNSFGYLAEYGSSRDMKELTASLDTIRKEANRLINAIDDKFHEICKDRGIEQIQPERAEPAAQPAAPAPAQETAPPQAAQPMPAAEQPAQPSREEAAKQTPEGEWDSFLPDPAIGLSEMAMYGYSQDGMMPLLQEKALELFDQGLPVYMLHSDNTEDMVLYRSDIEAYEGIFGVDTEDWQKTPEYLAQADHYEVYQIPVGDDTRAYRYATLWELQKADLSVDRANYELVYTAPLTATDTLGGVDRLLGSDDRPHDFPGRSLSTSDVVVMQRGGVATAYYADDIGFKEMPGFLAEKQPEKTAEQVASAAEQAAPESAPAPDKAQFGENVAAVEAAVKAGETINLSDLMGAIRADKQTAEPETPRTLYRKYLPLLLDEVRKSEIYPFLRDRDSDVLDAEAEIGNKLDSLAGQFKKNDPAFYAAYQSSPQFRTWLIEDILDRTFQDYTTKNGDSISQHEAEATSPDWAKRPPVAKQQPGGEPPPPTPPPVPKEKPGPAAPSEEQPMAKPIAECKLSDMVGAKIPQAAQTPAAPRPEPIRPADVPVYKQTVDYAREHGELDQWRQNGKLNTACATAIDEAIKASNYEPNHYDLTGAVKQVTAMYGADRMNFVLASVIQHQDYDGRYSGKNKTWAKAFDIPDPSKVHLNAHPCLVDGFADRAREAAALAKPSLMKTLEANEAKSRQQFSGAEKKEPQKKKGLEV